MADEKNTIEKLEERLANAATKFKEMKSQIDAKDKEIEELKNKVNDLEGELTLDGGAKEEVDGLKARLEKAKEIFATQKAKIAELTEKADENTKIAEVLRMDLTDAEKQATSYVNHIAELTEKLNACSQEKDSLEDILNQVKKIINN